MNENEEVNNATSDNGEDSNENVTIIPSNIKAEPIDYKLDTFSNKLATIVNTEQDETILRLKKAELYVEFIANSSLYNSRFKVPVYGDDGVTIVATKIDKPSILACIVLGLEIGLDPMAAISMGNKLNADAYLKINKGKSLGLDLTSSLQNISAIHNKNGIVTYHTSVQVISKIIIDSGTEMHFLEDAKNIFRYYDRNELCYVDDYEEHPEKYVSEKAPTEVLAAALKEGKHIISKRPDVRTTIRFIRKAKNIDLTFSYTRQEAIDAGLYRGFHSELVDKDGKPIYMEGRDNWNNNFRRLLRNRTISIGGNVVVADRLQGVYLDDEIQDVLESDSSAKVV